LEIEHEEQVLIHKFTWNVESWTKSELSYYRGNPVKIEIATSEAFKYGETKLVRAEFEMWEITDNFKGKTHKYTMRVLSYGYQNIGSSSIEEVTYSINEELNGIDWCPTKQMEMTETSTQNKKLLQVFTIPKNKHINSIILPFFRHIPRQDAQHNPKLPQ